MRITLFSSLDLIRDHQSASNCTPPDRLLECCSYVHDKDACTLNPKAACTLTTLTSSLHRLPRNAVIDHVRVHYASLHICATTHYMLQATIALRRQGPGNRDYCTVATQGVSMPNACWRGWRPDGGRRQCVYACHRTL